MLNPNHLAFMCLPDIPALSALGKSNQWVAWRYEDRGGPKPTKIPVNPRTGSNARSDDRSTWGTYQQAADRAQRDKLGGVGLMLSEDDDLTGYDLDKCRNPQTGFIKPWAKEIIGLRETYAEISPSGAGIRLWARGKLAAAIKYDPAGVEAYSHGRYLTVTGQQVEGAPDTINAAPLTRAACRARARLHAETWDRLKRAGPNLEFKHGKLVRKRRAPDAPASKPGGIREQVAGVNDRGQNPFWKNVNQAAMDNLGAWAPVLFPAAVYQTGTGAWRVSSKNLGRDLEEDLSIHPSGIRDWGIDDQSAPSGRQKHGAGAHSPISLVMQNRNVDAVEAATWLCDRLGRRPEDLGWNARERLDDGPNEDSEQHAAEHTVYPLIWHGDVNPLESRPWLVSDLIPEVGSGLVAGQWGTFKTFGVLDLAAAVMTRQDFIDFEVMRQGGVLFIAIEGANEIGIRLQAVIDTKCPQMRRAPFAWCSICPELLDPNAHKVLAAIAAQAAERMKAEFNLPLALIVIDTVVTGAGYTKDGQDNDTAASQRIMGNLAKLAQAAGCFVFGVDHFGKNLESGTKGSSNKESAADTVLAMLGERNVAGEVANTRLSLRKRRSGPAGVEFPFKTRVVDLGIDPQGVRVTSLVLDWSVPVKPAAKTEAASWAKSTRLLRQAMMTVLADQGVEQRPFADGPIVRAVNQEIVRAEFYRTYLAEGDAAQKQEARRKAFKRAVESAQGSSLISVREMGGAIWIWMVDPNA
jgi:AAA domain